jgi:hypothetical protein
LQKHNGLESGGGGAASFFSVAPPSSPGSSFHPPCAGVTSSTRAAASAALVARNAQPASARIAPCVNGDFRPGFWVRGSRAFARISSRTLGRYVAVTNPAPHRCRSNGFQRIYVYVALQTTPEEPRQRNGPLGAPKRRPDTPHSSCAAETTRRWDPLTGAHLGGAPRWRRPGRRRAEPGPKVSRNAQGHLPHQGENPTAPYAKNFASACRVTKNKK